MSETFLAAEPAAEPTTPASAGDVSPSSEPANQGRPAEGGWLASLPEDLRGVAETKGWKEPADALKSYQHLEELMGTDKASLARLPKDENDKESFNKIYNALGRPETPEGYELLAMVKEGEYDKGLLDTMSGAMHEAGISKKQGQTLLEAYQKEHLAAREAMILKHDDDVRAMKATYTPAQQEEVRRGYRELGITEEEAVAMEMYLGVERANKIYGHIGRRIAEDRPIEGAKSVGSVGSPEAAQRRMDELFNDPLFNKRYMNGDQGAIAEIAALAEKAARK